ncbi:unnamed protein product [Microthlaspi erraticum]|uniref:Uncharacterized protein n=1 Tax=Microthlaspi erraticum TaxID=1685480 RepID=A0A6D2K8V1_9BRAS|nr:unnamed protein product [Microthlaspi erraticum]
MIDFPFKGNSKSWVGYRRCGKVQCRLDRAVGNEDWHHDFSHTNVEYLKLWGSDHRPILTRILSKPGTAQRGFKFDKRWLGKDGLKKSIEEGWDQTNISDLEDRRRTLLEAKNRVTWLKEGDRNTKFFHATTKQRRARNRIRKLKRGDGSWAETEEDIERVPTDYFQNLFTSSHPTDFDEALWYVTEKVNPDINQFLTKPPSNEEIRLAIGDINPEKAPGPDGMTSLFYQQFWEITTKDVIAMVKEFFTSDSFDARLNQTNICMIPKSERPQEMSEFRPISLCNVSYKIISKVLCKRLKRFLPKLISETQSAFVAKRICEGGISSIFNLQSPSSLLGEESLQTQSAFVAKRIYLRSNFGDLYNIHPPYSDGS